jgi:hypothetical protein
MSVVLRCPNCGTTQAAPGECQACNEAQVRYFCTNHSPGSWLEGPSCPNCAAAAAARRASTRPPTTAPTRVRTHAPETTSLRARPRASVATPAPSSPDEDSTPLAPWQRLLGAALRARYVPPGVEPDRRETKRGVGGCLRRVVFLGIFLLLALAIAIFVFARSLIHELQLY